MPGRNNGLLGWRNKPANFSAHSKILLKSIYGNNLRRLGSTTAKKIFGKTFYGLNRKISFKELPLKKKNFFNRENIKI